MKPQTRLHASLFAARGAGRVAVAVVAAVSLRPRVGNPGAAGVRP